MDNFFESLSTIIFINVAMINLIYFKISKKGLFILIIISQIVTLPVYVFFPFISFVPINIILMIYLYKKTYDPFSSISTPIISTLIAVISDYIVSFIRIFILGMNFDITFKNHIAFIACVLSDCIIIFIISKLLTRFTNKKIEIFRRQRII